MRRAALAAALAWLSCATPPEAPSAGDRPYVLPWRERVTLFLCRWPAGPVAVALPSAASDAERRILTIALRAWERAGLGVRFRSASPARASLRIALVTGPVERDDGRSGSGRSLVDCRVEPGGRARLVAARVEIARSTGPDWRGRSRAHTAAELAGVAFHELGHALGFAGHVRGAAGPMAPSAENARRLGARLLRGQPVATDPLPALYARPSGSVLRSVPVSPWRTAAVDRLARLAERANLDGPFARVGDASARIFWRDPQAVEYGVAIANLEETLRDPSRILLLADPPARTAQPLRAAVAPDE